jgi:cytoskeletal protein CcmA (bactofilin family)
MKYSPNLWLRRSIGLVFLLASASAFADLRTTFPELGDPQTGLLRWAAFSLGGGISDTTLADDFSGNATIKGDVGVAGSGNIQLSGKALINGNLYYRSNGTLKLSGNAKITGQRFHNSNALLDDHYNRANTLDTHAFSFNDSHNYLVNGSPQTLTNITGNNNITIKATNPFSNVTLKLGNFTRTGGTVTLQGSSTNNFIINVTNQFSLSGNARIVLSGGLTWNDVLVNVHGPGGDVQMSGNSYYEGVLLSTKRTIKLSGNAFVKGELIANKISISGNGQVVHPPVTSP